MQALRTSGNGESGLERPRANSFFAGSAVYLAANVLNAAIPFALLPVLTRYLSPAEYGQVAMFQTLLAGLAAFIGVNVAGAAARKFYDHDIDDAGMARFMASCLQIVVATGVATLIASFAVRDRLGAWLGIDAYWILWSVLAASSMVVIGLRLGQWQISRNATSYGMLQVGQSACNVGLSLLCVVTLGLGADGRIGAQVLTAVLFMLVALVFLRREGLLTFFVWDAPSLKEALKFGIPLLPHTAGIFLLTAVDRFVINGALGLGEAGIYMVAAQLSLVLALVFDAVNKAYVPWLFERLKRGEPDEARQVVRLTYWGFALALGLAGIAFAVGPQLVLLIAGPGYEKAGDAIGWLALGQAFGGMYLLVTNYIFYSKRTALLSLVSVLGGCFNVLLLLLLVPRFGIDGAAFAFACAMGIRFFLTWWVAHKRHPMPWFGSTAA